MGVAKEEYHDCGRLYVTVTLDEYRELVKAAERLEREKLESAREWARHKSREEALKAEADALGLRLAELYAGRQSGADV